MGLGGHLVTVQVLQHPWGPRWWLLGPWAPRKPPKFVFGWFVALENFRNFLDFFGNPFGACGMGLGGHFVTNRYFSSHGDPHSGR